MPTQAQANEAASASEAGAVRDSVEVGPAWQAACEAGLDMSLVEMNLRGSPWERWLAHDEALHFSLLLHQAVKTYHGQA